MSKNKLGRRTSAEDDAAYVPDVQPSRRFQHNSFQVQPHPLKDSHPARLSAPQLGQNNLLDAHPLEQLQSTWGKQQQEQLDIARTTVMSLQNQAGRKRKHIQDLRSEVLRKQQRILSLEQCLQKYQNICSYMVSQAQVMTEHF